MEGCVAMVYDNEGMRRKGRIGKGVYVMKVCGRREGGREGGKREKGREERGREGEGGKRGGWSCGLHGLRIPWGGFLVPPMARHHATLATPPATLGPAPISLWWSWFTEAGGHVSWCVW